MSLYDSIQIGTVQAQVPWNHSEILINEIVSQKDDIHSITACNILDDSNRTTAVNKIERHRQFFDYEHMNPESYQLILLHKNVNNAGQETTLFLLEELRKVLKYTKFFNNVEEALQFIEQTKDTITFLVYSGCLDEIIVSQIHVLKNIRSIYIYCHEEHDQKRCPQEYTKAREVYTDLQLLLKDLRYDVEQYLQQAKDGIFSEIGRDNYSTNILTFSWWNYVISMICHLTYPDSCRETFLMTLRHYYQDRNPELKTLDEFERTYTSDTAIRWYTCNTFIFYLINRALRQKNLEVIFLFGFFIKDMYNQLKIEHENFKTNHTHNPKLKVYRGQIISSDEMSVIRDNTDFITTSFFSTTLNHSLALFLIESSSPRDDQLQNILFEIELDTRFVSHPFGHVSNLSSFPDEDEVLFMIGAQFKIIECSHDDNKNMYLAKLKLEDKSALKQEYDIIGITSRVTLKNCVNEISNHLYKVSLEDINSLFVELQELFPPETGWLDAAKYFMIAKIYIQFHVKHYPEYINITLAKLEQALKIYQSYLNDSELVCAIDIGRICLNVCFVYNVYVKDNILANNYYDLGITSCTLSLPSTVDKHKRIELYDTIVLLSENRATITDDETQRREILLNCIRYLELQLEELSYLPSDHSDVLHCIHHLAELQNTAGLIIEATMNYEKVVQIYLLQYEPNFALSAEIYGKISKMCVEQKRDYTLASHYKKEELKYRMAYKATTINFIGLVDSVNCEVAETHEDLADIYIQLYEYRLAHENLIISKQLYEKTDCYQKEKKIKVIESKIRDIELFLTEDYGLTQLFTIN